MNLGYGVAYPLREVVERVRDLVNPSLALQFGAVPYRPDQVMHLQADITKLTRATGWQPVTALDEGLRRTVAWYRSAEAQKT
jgi:nucleoside-diphosphate-sugar epimerase